MMSEDMDQRFWVGVYPGLAEKMLDYVIESISDFLSKEH
jgi:dTDP-4-amino-4,6-dideoxygalactose transaminase